jgi:hypothetical protein
MKSGWVIVLLLAYCSAAASQLLEGPLLLEQGTQTNKKADAYAYMRRSPKGREALSQDGVVSHVVHTLCHSRCVISCWLGLQVVAILLTVMQGSL